MDDLKTRLARLLVEKAYREGSFTLASGRHSDYYFDCRCVALSAVGARLIGELFAKTLDGLPIKGVGGMSVGADPLVTATCIMSGAKLDGLLVRKEPKDHGVGRYVIGLENFEKGDRVAVLDDVVTTGSSILKACDRIRESGLEIELCCAILDREEGGREAIEKAGYRFKPLFRRVDLQKILLQNV